jgi:hypothetical protein
MQCLLLRKQKTGVETTAKKYFPSNENMKWCFAQLFPQGGKRFYCDILTFI